MNDVLDVVLLSTGAISLLLAVAVGINGIRHLWLTRPAKSLRQPPLDVRDGHPRDNETSDHA